jgi:opacity protein-like surface antigen
MMKRCSFLILLCCWSLALHAQDQPVGPLAFSSSPGGHLAAFSAPTASKASYFFSKNSPVKFGLRIGVNYSNMNFNKGYPRPTEPVKSSWKAGASAGLLMQIQLHNKFSLQQEYLFSQLSSEVESTNSSYRNWYLSIPIMLKYRVLPKVSLMAGPQFDLLVQATENTDGQTVSTTHETEARSIWATAGVEVQVTKNISVGARYLQGLNHIGIRRLTRVEEFKYESVQTTLGFHF